MHSETPAFRSKREREKEVMLVKNYRDIGISAIAAASNACRSARKDKMIRTEQTLVAAE